MGTIVALAKGMRKQGNVIALVGCLLGIACAAPVSSIDEDKATVSDYHALKVELSEEDPKVLTAESELSTELVSYRQEVIGDDLMVRAQARHLNVPQDGTLSVHTVAGLIRTHALIIEYHRAGEPSDRWLAFTDTGCITVADMGCMYQSLELNTKQGSILGREAFTDGDAEWFSHSGEQYENIDMLRLTPLVIDTPWPTSLAGSYETPIRYLREENCGANGQPGCLDYICDAYDLAAECSGLCFDGTTRDSATGKCAHTGASGHVDGFVGRSFRGTAMLRQDEADCTLSFGNRVEYDISSNVSTIEGRLNCSIPGSPFGDGYVRVERRADFRSNGMAELKDGSVGTFSYTFDPVAGTISFDTGDGIAATLTRQ